MFYFCIRSYIYLLTFEKTGMVLPNIFAESVTNNLIDRINKLTVDTEPNWGKMDTPKMLAHCNVTYEMVHENIHPKPNFLMKFFLKSVIKKIVVSDTAFKKNSQTAPVFLIKSSKDFENEKSRLIGYLKKTQQLGETHFDGKESTSFGKLSVPEWNNLFYKHIDHHLTQFGV